MKRSWTPPKEDRIDAESVRLEQQFRQDLRDILEHGDENDFVVLLKTHRPEISPEELREMIMQFRVYVREKRGLC
jgi:hypothetical protein